MEIKTAAGCNAALYIRLSKEDDNGAESQSVTNQRRMLGEFAEKHGINVYDEYIDDGFSGGNFDRPAFNRMIADIEAGKVNMVITKDMSRLGRDYIQTGHYMERYFPEKRVRYISLLDGVDTGADSSMNDITPFRAIMNDLYAKDISRKIKSVKRDKQRRGLFIGGKAPYGYKLSSERENTLEIDGEAANVVKLIFDMALAGKTCRETAAWLNEQKISPPAVYASLPVSGKGPYSGLWSAERVTATLKNQMYAGDMVQGTTRRVSYKSKKCVRMPKEQWVVVENTHPAIIERADFDKVQLLISSRARTRTRKYDYLLKGLIFCGECGYPLGVVNRVLADGRPALYFVCRTYQRFTKAGMCTSHCVRVETVTEAVTEHIKALCGRHIDREAFNEIAREVMKDDRESGRREADTERLRGQIAGITANMDKLYADRLDGTLDEADFQRLYAKMKNSRAGLRNKLDGQQRGAAELPAYSVDGLVERFIESVGENRELLCSLVERIELTADREARIYFRFGEAAFTITDALCITHREEGSQ